MRDSNWGLVINTILNSFILSITHTRSGYFKDIQVKVEGPAAAHLGDVVNESLLRLRATDPSLVIDVPNTNQPVEDISTEGAPVWVFLY